MENTSLKLSIIICVYNTEESLERCLKSILLQRIKDIEIIVVNDNSSDDCDQIINKIKGEIKYIKLKKRVGIYNAREIGVKKSKGQYIGFVDSDDYVDRNMFLKLYKHARRSNSDIVECGYKILFDRKQQNIGIKAITCNGYEAFNSLYRLNTNFRPSHNIWNKIYKRELWERSKEYFPKMNFKNDGGEDLIRTSILFYYANKYSSINKCLYYYNRINAESASQSINKNKIIRYIDGLKICFESLEYLITNDSLTIFELIENKLWFDILDIYIRISKVSEDLKKNLLNYLVENLYEYIVKVFQVNKLFFGNNYTNTELEKKILFNILYIYLNSVDNSSFDSLTFKLKVIIEKTSNKNTIEEKILLKTRKIFRKIFRDNSIQYKILNKLMGNYK